MVDDELGECQRPFLRVGVFVGHGPRICFPKFEVKRSILLEFDRKSAVFNHLSFETKNMTEKRCGTQATTTMDRVLLFLSLVFVLEQAISLCLVELCLAVDQKSNKS